MENDKASEKKSKTFLLKTRAWLNNNKIFFETLTACFLSFMAIIISYLQYEQGQMQNNLAEKQCKLMDLQTQAAVQSISPQFEITARQLDEKGTGVYTDDKIFVQNSGCVVSEFKCEYAVFFDVEMTPHVITKGQQVKKRIPVNGYYAATIHSPAGKGLLVTILCSGNNDRAVKLMRNFGDLSNEMNYYGFIKVKRYLKIKYRDLLGTHHTRYYYIPLIFGAYELSLKDGEDVFQEWKNNVYKNEYFDFQKITPEAIIQRVLSNDSK